MTDAKGIAHDSSRLIETSDAELAERIIAVDFVNDEAKDDPDDQITRHRAVRDDLGLLLQPGQ